MGLTCISCHGTLEDHALSLLLMEQKAGKPGASRLMRHLRPRHAKYLDEIKPRIPWLNEPDCLKCHIDFNPPDKGASAFNKWTSGPEDLYRMRTDEIGVFCQACHGNTHEPARLHPSAIRRNQCSSASRRKSRTTSSEIWPTNSTSGSRSSFDAISGGKRR